MLHSRFPLWSEPAPSPYLIWSPDISSLAFFFGKNFSLPKLVMFHKILLFFLKYIARLYVCYIFHRVLGYYSCDISRCGFVNDNHNFTKPNISYCTYVCYIFHRVLGYYSCDISRCGFVNDNHNFTKPNISNCTYVCYIFHRVLGYYSCAISRCGFVNDNHNFTKPNISYCT